MRTLSLVLVATAGCSWLDGQQKKALIDSAANARDRAFSEVQLAQLKPGLSRTRAPGALQLALTSDNAHVDNTAWVRSLSGHLSAEGTRAVLMAQHDLALTSSTKNPYLRPALFDALSAQVTQQKELLPRLGMEPQGRLELLIDARVTFGQLVGALYTAGQSELGELELTVQSGQYRAYILNQLPQIGHRRPAECTQVFVVVEDTLHVATKLVEEDCKELSQAGLQSAQELEARLRAVKGPICEDPLLTAHNKTAWSALAAAMAAFSRARAPSPKLVAGTDATSQSRLRNLARCPG